MNDKKSKRPKEILRIKYVENGETITNFSMEFRRWRRMHRGGGGCPFILETSGRDMFNMNHIEITLRSEEADAFVEGQINEKEVKNKNE